MKKNPRLVRRNPIVSLMCLQRTLSILSQVRYLPPALSLSTYESHNYIILFHHNKYKRLHSKNIMAKFNFAAFLVALSLGEMVLIILADMYGVFVVLVGWLGVGGSTSQFLRPIVIVVSSSSSSSSVVVVVLNRSTIDCRGSAKPFYSWKTMEPETIKHIIITSPR